VRLSGCFAFLFGFFVSLFREVFCIFLDKGICWVLLVAIMLVFFSLLPLVLLIFLMVSPTPRRFLPLPATIALPAMAVLVYGLQWTIFAFPGADSSSGTDIEAAMAPSRSALIHGAVLSGLFSSFTPLAIVFGAILFFKTLETSGAMAVLTARLKVLTPDPVAQCLLIGWAFSYLVEGLSGFGTPAALAAPILVGLLGGQVPVVRIAALCLVMNSVPVSFGAVGTPTWFGFGQLNLDQEILSQIARNSAWIHGVAAPFIVLMALRIVLPWSFILQRWAFVGLVVLGTMIPSILVAQVSAEFPSIIGGLCGLVVAGVAASRDWGLPRDGALAPTEESGPGAQERSFGLFAAVTPILLVIAMLAVTRLEPLGIKQLLNLDQPKLLSLGGADGFLSLSAGLVLHLGQLFGTVMDVRIPLLYVPFIIPFVVVSLISIPLLRMSGEMVVQCWAESFRRLIRPTIAMIGALILVRLLMLGVGSEAPAMILGMSLGSLTGGLWPYFASFLGALGSFFSGSNTVSNLTFGPIQYIIAEKQGLPLGLILALQSVGGAMGNMVCIHNIVAVVALLGLREPGKRRASERQAAGSSPNSGPDNDDNASVGGVADILKLTFPPMLVYGIITAICAGFYLSFS
jgi:lactate permease